MPRPSQGLDRALLQAGIDEIKLGGVRGLSVRAVCARAGVSIRMLNYYFGSKDEFVRLLLTKTYEHFFNTLRSSVETGGAPLDRLRTALHVCVAYAVKNEAVTRSLWMDANSGVPLVVEMVEKLFPRHTNLMFELLYEAWKEGTLRQDIPPMQIFTAIVPGVFAAWLWDEKYFPQGASIPEDLRCLPPDPVKAAIQNFTCLIEGFKAKSRAGVSAITLQERDAAITPTIQQGRGAAQRRCTQSTGV